MWNSWQVIRVHEAQDWNCAALFGPHGRRAVDLGVVLEDLYPVLLINARFGSDSASWESAPDGIFSDSHA